MIYIGIYLLDASVSLTDADDIEAIVYTNNEEQVFLKSTGGVILLEDGTCRIFVPGKFAPGIIYCKFRTVKDGITSEWYIRHLGFI